MEFLGTIWDLYFDVIQRYPLAGALVTILVSFCYPTVKEFRKEIDSTEEKFWSGPLFVLFMMWLIITPIVGLLCDIISTVGGALGSLVTLFSDLYGRNPLAGALVALVLLNTYFVWKFLVKRKFRYSIPILVLSWLVLTPIIGFILHVALGLR